MSTDWLSLVPVCSAYAFNAALICEDCAGGVIEDLRKRGIEDTGDTNDFPQEVGGRNESDSPDHCDFGHRCLNTVKVPGGSSIGCPLECQLTPDGVKYVRGGIADHILFGSPHQKAIGRLWYRLFKDSLDGGPLVKLLESSGAFPPSIKKALGSQIHLPTFIPEIFTDLNYVYGGAADRDGRQTILWRLAIDSLGHYVNPEIVGIPASETTERDLGDLLEEAISSGAWD